MKKFLFAAVLFFLFHAAALAQETREPIILRSQRVIFFNHDCEKTQSCSLKNVSYVAEKYKIEILGIYHYGNRFAAVYETDSLATLEDYTFIQFVRGCRYYSWLENGEVKIEFGYSVKHGNDYVMACFPNWVIDTDNSYPDYCADPDGRSRHFMCRFKEGADGDLFSRDGVNLYGEEKPKTPALYITDHPSNVYELGGVAINNSFLIRTCLYKTTDVPMVVDLSDTQFAEPIYCFEWRNSFVYNHEKKEFEESDEIIPEHRDKTE